LSVFRPAVGPSCEATCIGNRKSAHACGVLVARARLVLWCVTASLRGVARRRFLIRLLRPFPPLKSARPALLNGNDGPWIIVWRKPHVHGRWSTAARTDGPSAPWFDGNRSPNGSERDDRSTVNYINDVK